jgi:hypothetical protein
MSAAQLTVFENTSSLCEADGGHHEVSFLVVVAVPFIIKPSVWEKRLPLFIIRSGRAIGSH